MTVELLPAPTGPAPATPTGPALATPTGPALATPTGPALATPTGPAPAMPTGAAPATPAPAARVCRLVCDGFAAGLRFVGIVAVFVVLFAVLAGLTGLLGALWYLVFWFVGVECHEDDAACSFAKMLANVSVAVLCVVCGGFATCGLYCLRVKKFTYAEPEPVCDALRINTVAFLWCGILAVWALQYIVLFVVRSAFLACLIPFLHLAVAAVVYPIDYYVGTRIYPDSAA